MPSEATAVGRRSPLRDAVRFRVAVVKSGWPRTTEAWPTHTGHLRLAVNSAVGLGNIDDAPLYSRTRWFEGIAPTRFESATKSVSAAKAKPLAAPIMTSLEFGSWLVKVV